MKSLLTAIFILVIVITVYFYQKHLDSIINSGRPKKSEETQEQKKYTSPNKQNIPQNKKKPGPIKKTVTPEREEQETVTITKRESGMIFFQVTCPFCHKENKEIKQTRSPFAGQKKMEVFRCSYCGKTKRIYIEGE